jgi:hypothetical protein
MDENATDEDIPRSNGAKTRGLHVTNSEQSKTDRPSDADALRDEWFGPLGCHPTWPIKLEPPEYKTGLPCDWFHLAQPMSPHTSKVAVRHGCGLFGEIRNPKLLSGNVGDNVWCEQQPNGEWHIVATEESMEE